MEKKIEKVLNEEIKEEFKSRFDMKEEDLNKLIKLRVKLSRQKTKKGMVFYNIYVKFGDYKVLSSRIEEKKYNIALLENKIRLDRDEFVKDCPVRFSKGISNKTNKEFYMYDVFVSESIRLALFLDQLDLREFELTGLQYDFVERGLSNDEDNDLLSNEF